jgi:chromosome segregation ATPase
MNEASGNPEALRAHKEASMRQTRQDLYSALARLRNGNPRRVKRGIPVSATSVAEEAGVDRSTLYRYHEPILIEIRKLNDATPKKQLQAKRGEVAGALSKAREYRKALEDARAEMNEWARQNYALSHRVQELESLLRDRDKMIVELQEKLNGTGKVVSLQLVPANN